jgi:hypothetical protein
VAYPIVMNRKLVWLLTVFLLGWVHLGEAQQPSKIPTIGYLTGGPPAAMVARTEAFRQGLRELGWVEHNSGRI